MARKVEIISPVGSCLLFWQILISGGATGEGEVVYIVWGG